MRLVSRLLLRAPLLPVFGEGEGTHGARESRESPAREAPIGLGDALALAGRAHLEGEARAQAALTNWEARARARPTPHGLFAGVGVALLGDETQLALSPPRAWLALSFARAAALGRALLDDAVLRQAVTLAVAPSLLIGREVVRWLGRSADGGARAEWRSARRDALLDAVVASAQPGAPWSAVRAATGAAWREQAKEDADDAAIDGLLLELVDDGLLSSDLEPPVIGPTPDDWLASRLGQLLDALPRERRLARRRIELLRGELQAVGRLLGDAARPVAARLTEARARLGALPGDEELLGAEALQGVLCFDPRPEGPPLTVRREVVERAARLLPLLGRLAEALMPPTEERLLDEALGERLRGLSELWGEGRYSLVGLVDGAYGDALVGTRPAGRAPLLGGVVVWLLEALIAAARDGSDSLELDPDVLDALLPPGPPPPSAELFLHPRAGAPDGQGWLLGLHAPAGATWGRFAHALGGPLLDGLRELAALEAASGPEAPLDVAWAPSRSVGELVAHPPIRARALAALGRIDGSEAVALSSLSLQLTDGGPRAWCDAAGRRITPSPLSRLRSSTAPDGLAQLLVGWQLRRQHAPWALCLGPLGDLEQLPRLLLDGFVISPQSWRLPPPTQRGAEALSRWAAEVGLPRHVQVGHEDELLWLDLESEGCWARLARAAGDDLRARVVELWPPPGEELEASGRRVELVAAVLFDGEVPGAAAPGAAADLVTADSGPVSGLAAPDWVTLRLYCTDESADAVLLETVAPVIDQLRRQERLVGWHVQRYVEGPGHRFHLRLRLCPPACAAAVEESLATQPLGRVVAVDRGPFLAESGRFGEALSLTLAVAEADSDHLLALLPLLLAAEDSDSARLESLVGALDTQAQGLGLSVDARHRLAQAERAAWQSALGPDFDEEEARRAHRALGPRLKARLTNPLDAERRYLERLTDARQQQPTARGSGSVELQLCAALGHRLAVRLIGAAPMQEALACYLWERALDGLLAQARRR